MSATGSLSKLRPVQTDVRFCRADIVGAQSKLALIGCGLGGPAADGQ